MNNYCAFIPPSIAVPTAIQELPFPVKIMPYYLSIGSIAKDTSQLFNLHYYVKYIHYLFRYIKKVAIEIIASKYI